MHDTFLANYHDIIINSIAIHVLESESQNHEIDGDLLRMRRRLQLLPFFGDSKEQQQRQRSSSDATLNGVPTTYRDPSSPSSSSSKPLYSSVHCVGENFNHDSWMYRSCEFRNLCFDVEQRKYVLYPTPEERSLEELMVQDRAMKHLLEQKESSSYITISSLMSSQSLSLGPLYPYWSNGPPESEQWFPTISAQDLITGYYELPESVVLIPFTVYSATEYIIWETLLPIYTLMSTFGLDKKKRPLLIRATAQTGECTESSESIQRCDSLLEEFLPMLGAWSNDGVVRTESYTTLRTSDLKAPRSNLVCSRYAAAGIGMISDQGVGRSGPTALLSHVVGRGPTLRAFRNYMARHLDVVIPTMITAMETFTITFAMTISQRQGGFVDDQQANVIRKSFQWNNNVVVQAIRLDELNITEQARTIASSSILVMDSGSKTPMATFLPRGACLVIYSSPTTQHPSSAANAEITERQILSNAGYFRTFWKTKDSPISDLLLIVQRRLESYFQNELL